MSEVIYYMPIFLTLHVEWDSKFQAVTFMAASILGVTGSYFAPKLISIGYSPNRTKQESVNELDKIESKYVETAKRNSLYSNQVFLSISALSISLVGQAFMIGASEALKHRSMPTTNSGIFFFGRSVYYIVRI